MIRSNCGGKVDKRYIQFGEGMWAVFVRDIFRVQESEAYKEVEGYNMTISAHMLNAVK